MDTLKYKIDGISLKEWRENLLISRTEIVKLIDYDISVSKYKYWETNKTKNIPDIFFASLDTSKQKIIDFSKNKLKYYYFDNYKKRKPKGFWERKETHRFALEWLCKKMDWEFPYGLYQIDKYIINKYKLFVCGSYYNSSPTYFVSTALDEYNWKFWLFKYPPSGSFTNDVKLKDYFSWFEKQKNIHNPSDWYDIYCKDLIEYHCSSFLLRDKFNYNIYRIAKYVHPDFDYKPWKFKVTSRKTFSISKLDDAKQFIEDIANAKGYKELEDYHGLTKDDFSDLYQGIKKYYGGFINMLKAVYPQYEFKEWLFNLAPNNFWLDKKNIIRYMLWLENRLGIKSYEEWYEISNDLVIMHYGDSALKHGLEDKVNHNLNVFDLVRILHPNYNWDVTLFDNKSKSQKRLYRLLEIIFPNYNIEYNRRYKFLRNPKTNVPLELDIFIPDKKLAFEYQGEQHTHFNERYFHKRDGIKGFIEQQKRDVLKRNKCKEHDIKLIEVDYKWDGRLETLVDILNNEGLNI